MLMRIHLEQTNNLFFQNVIKSTVLKATGLQAWYGIVNGRSLNVSGETTTSYWAKTGAGNMTYKFAIGGTDSDCTKAWDALLHNPAIKTNSSNQKYGKN